MVIYPIVDEQKRSPGAIPVWDAIVARQKQPASHYWIITQPSHAALAGDLAAALRDDLFGPIDDTIARSIALHDAGWGLDDAEQIERLRANPKLKPQSFLEASPPQFIDAWQRSINVAEKFSPLGGYLASRHFERLSSLTGEPAAKSDSKLEAFRQQEKSRQEKLRLIIKLDESALERLVDCLQFCDVLSLYLCCGAQQTVTFENPKLTLSRTGEEYRLHPSPFKDRSQFSFSALRHPVSRDMKSKSGAAFHINL